MCGHSYKCDCYTYKTKYHCRHIHMIAKEQLIPGQARSGNTNPEGLGTAGLAATEDHMYWVIFMLIFRFRTQVLLFIVIFRK